MIARKRPVEVFVEHFDHTYKHEHVAAWCGGVAGFDIFGYPVIRISTLEGEMTASLGDYVIRGVKGEFYPCKPDIFRETYEVVERQYGDEPT